MLTHSQLAEIASTVYQSPWTATVQLNVHFNSQELPDETVVALPGTHPREALDWLRDFSFWPVRVRGLGLVHSGFGLGARAAWIQLAPKLSTERLVTFTGHSLGGALALCLAGIHAYERPGIPFRVVTFGAPRVSFLNYKFAALLKSSRECAVYGRIGDLVPQIPFKPWYRHGAKTIGLGSVPRLNPLEAHSMAHYATDLGLLGV